MKKFPNSSYKMKVDTQCVPINSCFHDENTDTVGDIMIHIS